MHTLGESIWINITYFGYPNFIKYAALTTAAHSVMIPAKLYI